MRETGTGALGRFVRSGRESLCLVRARGDSLVLETLYLAEDVYSDAEITEAVGTAEVKAPELELAHQIIDSLEGSFDPKALTSTYRRDLRALLEAKLDGVELPQPDEPEAPAAPAVDLLEALRASVEAAKSGGDKSARAKKPAAKAKKPAAKPAGEVAVTRLEVAALRSCRVSPGGAVETPWSVSWSLASGGLRDGQSAGLELNLEQVLVDLSLIDRDALLDAELDDRIAVDAELVRELFRRQVIRHASPPLSNKKARPRKVRSRADSTLGCRLTGFNGPASRNAP